MAFSGRLHWKERKGERKQVLSIMGNLKPETQCHARKKEENSVKIDDLCSK